ncbi:MAG: 50S ribosomal protein L10 [Acidiferrobacterales bacterium]|nr:50S ribosomal protein L10 [Acidiferrobacterales bacterium]
MNENLERKHQIVDAVHKDLESAKLAVLSEYRGVDVAGMGVLRREAREANVRIQVVKNTLARRAVDDTDFECLKEHFNGPLALAVADDPVAVAKTLSEFAAKNTQFRIQTGAMNGQLISAEQLEQIAKLPGRDELLARLMGTMAAPIQKFVSTLNEIPSGFVRVLAAVRDSEESSESESSS